MAVIYGSSQTNPNYANYRGSQTYAPRDVSNTSSGTMYGQPYLGTSATPSTQIPTGGSKGGSAGTQAPTSNYMGSGMNQDQYMAEINNAYNSSYDALNKQYDTTMAGQQNFYDQFTQPYEAQKPLLEQAYTSGVNLNKQQQNTNSQNALNQTDQSRRLYNELSQGVHQRFGGANSAGEFANAFYGREFQRQMGGIQNTQGQNQQALLSKLQDIQGEHDAKLQSLEMQKQAALAQAKDAFQQRLDAINNARSVLDQNKAQLKLQALQEFRQRAYQVQDQANQLAQQLQLIHAQAGAALGSQVNAFGNSANTPTATNPYLAQQYAMINNMAPGSKFNQPMVVGSIGKSVVGRDPNGNFIYSDGTQGPGGFLTQ